LVLKNKMINWWGPKTIPIANKIWKPGINPIKTFKNIKNTWFNSSKEAHTKVLGDFYPNLKPETIHVTRKIKIRPTKEQRDILTQWWHGYRATYNKTIEAIGQECPDRIITPFIDEDGLEKERFEMKREWNLDISKNTYTKVKLKLKYKKINGETKVFVDKIQVVSDPLETPFKYQPIQHWHNYRDEYVTAKDRSGNIKDFTQQYPYLLKIDKTIRASAVKDACAAYKTICTLGKDYNRKGTLGPMLYKRKKYGDSWSISMEKSKITPCTITKTTIGRKGKEQNVKQHGFYICPQKLKTPIKCLEKIPEKFGDPKLHKDKYGDWWLLLPIETTKKYTKSTKPAIAFDPGISTFLTGYSGDGAIYNYVSNEKTLLKTLKSIDVFQSKIATKDVKEKNKQQKMTYLRKKVQNKIEDMHWKVINNTIQNHNVIVIGKLKVQHILKSDSISKNAKRKLQALSHYKFKERLRYKCSAEGAVLKVQNEWGTTKGCPCCGKSNNTPLSERVYKCQKCNYEAGRDAKAACCIMIKHLAGVK